MFRTVVAMSLWVSLSSCGASLSLKDCEALNWYQKGVEDAIDGEEVSVFYLYQQTCSGSANQANESEYVQGFRYGQKSICTEQTGYNLGRKGKKMNQSCPAKSGYMIGFAKGYEEFKALKEERQANNITRSGLGNNMGAAPSGGP